MNDAGRPFRWGILSTARIAREQLVPAIHEAQGSALTAIASRDAERAREFADWCGAPLSFGSYEKLLDCDEVEAVYIPLPTSQHVEWAIQAADAGKHVLVEKPLAMRAEEIERVIDARDRNNVVVSEAFMVTYHPQWLKVRELIRSGAIGELRHVQGAFSYYNVDPDNMRNRPELGGGALLDIGVYPSVTTRFVTEKEPERVQAVVERDPDFGTDSYASVKAEFGSFELGFYVSTQMALRQLMVFHGEEGFIEVLEPFNAGIYGDQRVVLHDRNHREAQAFRYTGTKQYCLQVEAFAQAAAGGSAEIFTLEQSFANQKMIDAIFRAGEQDEWEIV